MSTRWRDTIGPCNCRATFLSHKYNSLAREWISEDVRNVVVDGSVCYVESVCKVQLWTSVIEAIVLGRDLDGNAASLVVVVILFAVEVVLVKKGLRPYVGTNRPKKDVIGTSVRNIDGPDCED